MEMRTFVELVERYEDPEFCPYPEYKGKPYYSIKYIENGEEYVGYSTYSLRVISEFLKKYFISYALEKQEQNRWIPCSVRLPVEKDAGILKKLGTDKRSDYVLATVEVKGERMTVTACTYDGKWDWNMKYAFPDYKVIAWRPLPEPYQEKES